jgi:hypothetical protein
LADLELFDDQLQLRDRVEVVGAHHRLDVFVAHGMNTLGRGPGMPPEQCDPAVMETAVAVVGWLGRRAGFEPGSR